MGKKENRRRRKKKQRKYISENVSFKETSEQNEVLEDKFASVNLKDDYAALQILRSNIIQKSNCDITLEQKNLRCTNIRNGKLSNDMEVDLLKTNTFSENKVYNNALPDDRQNSYESSVMLFASSSYSSTRKNDSADNFDKSDSETENSYIEPMYYGVKPKKGNPFKIGNYDQNFNQKFKDNMADEQDLPLCSKSFKVPSDEEFYPKHQRTNSDTITSSYAYKKTTDNFSSIHCNSLQNGHSNTTSVEIYYGEKFNLEHGRLNADILANPVECEKSMEYFSSIYSNWLQIRQDTLKKLETLVHDLHNEQLNYNKSQKTCREVGLISRQVKNVPLAIGFVASVSAFLSDAASGIVSAVQAFNVDAYQTKFQEIIEEDEKAIKDLYEARSQSLVKYQGIEEVTRKFHSHTFTSTVNEISNALEISKYQIAVANAYDSNHKARLLNNFINKACQSETLEKIGDSVKTYVDDNPAVLEVCKSATRAVVGVVDSLGVGKNKNAIGRAVSAAKNQLMIMEDIREIEHLRCTIDEDLSQTKLETQIEDTIHTLKSEMEEIVEDYAHYCKLCSYLVPDYESGNDLYLQNTSDNIWKSDSSSCDDDWLL